LKLVDFKISKSELGAFFRREDHPKYMPLQDQILRNFLNALVIHKRGPMERKSSDINKLSKDSNKGDFKRKPAGTSNPTKKGGNKLKITRRPDNS
jgi:hypothetical protein